MVTALFLSSLTSYSLPTKSICIFNFVKRIRTACYASATSSSNLRERVLQTLNLEKLWPIGPENDYWRNMVKEYLLRRLAPISYRKWAHCRKITTLIIFHISFQYPVTRQAIIAKYNETCDQIMRFGLNFFKLFDILCIYWGVEQKVGWVPTHFLA